jgi:hypothetical protein
LTALFNAQKKPSDKFFVIKAALDLGAVLGEKPTVRFLKLLLSNRDAIPIVEDCHEVEQRSSMLEVALFFAGHYGQSEYLQFLVSTFLNLLETQQAVHAATFLANLARESLRNMRKFGLRHEIEKLLQRICDLMMQGQDMPALRSRFGPNWRNILTAILRVAEGWLFFDRVDQAMPLLDEARESLAKGCSPHTSAEHTRLACAYVQALSQAPVQLALDRLEELFLRLFQSADVLKTSSHYCLTHLEVIESVVLAVLSDDFALGQHVRRWLDEDEYLVRRRIHRDLRQLMNQAGL